MENIPSGFLSGVSFRLQGKKLKDLACKKMLAYKIIVTERERRIAQYRKEHSITNADLIDLLRQLNNNTRTGNNISNYTLPLSGGVKTKSIPAGVVSAMETEHSNIAREKAAIHRLRLITENMDIKKTFDVTLSDLEFLGL